MNHLWQSILTDGNTQWVLLSTLLLGIASGVLGSFALLRKQSLIGDAVAHAALPGICFAFMFMGEKNFFVLLIGAAATGLLAAYTIQLITNTTRIKEDTAICLVLSVFFGLGIVLLTKVAQMPTGNQSGLDDFIFGQAASLVGRDVQLMGLTAAALIIITSLLFKEFKVSTFDPQFAKGIGLPVGFLNFLFVSLLVITVVIGIQAVGVILMAAMLITPAISARYWTDSLRTMVFISGMVGGLSGAIGTLISTLGKGLSTGPFIVLTATVIFIISMLFSPKRGLISVILKRLKNDDRLAMRFILKKMYESGKQTIRVEYLFQQSNISNLRFNRVLKHLMKKGYLNQEDGILTITKSGLMKAEQFSFVDEIMELKEMYPSELGSLDIQWIEKEEKEALSKEQLTKLQMKMSDIYMQYPFLNVKMSSRRGGQGYEL
ncbi:metal ABC transporter permease [Rossellomorea aquimaris]|uniref:Manganese transport system membrane protein MntC n=1 Tax=Rossellomorea aquimaris TaxID=189382 RepID=A0A5D4TTC9_9BACI|nr:metal ABC transporter permease [Rossellomorea aquimaris]TYS77336.1 metal ABC transporter permease [Rossellomorea aquimaris]TYS86517.1 metal ABC transporter permease [Rossellomorea aquimaris]